MYISMLLLTFSVATPLYADEPSVLRLTESSVRFTSNAPLEIIKASTTEMTGLIDIESGAFAFRIPMKSFLGFNSPLQMEHFHENYMESDKYKHATFQGRIIEDVDFTNNGQFNVRTKGMLTIHGIAVERIVKADITISGDEVLVTSNFVIPLSDHNISTPKIVEQKIAREISVKLEATFHFDEAP